MYVRSIVFGINDSLVSTVGFLAGISVAGVPRATIVLTGIVYALVEAFSMAMGDFLSEESAEEYARRKSVKNLHPALAGVFMFFSSALAALVPLSPYMFIASGSALAASAGLSVAALFIVGTISARFSRLPVVWRGVRMALLGGAAIVIGVAVGSIIPAI